MNPMRLTVEWKVRANDGPTYPMPAVVTCYSVRSGIRYARQILRSQGFECVEPYHVTIHASEDQGCDLPGRHTPLE